MDLFPLKASDQEIVIDMIHVEGGEFVMGSEHKHAWDREKPIHRVQLDSFLMSKYPISQAIWKEVMRAENNPSYFQGNDRPVEMVSWDECQDFIQKLNSFTGKVYRLPTEVEWEYAAEGDKKVKAI